MTSAQRFLLEAAKDVAAYRDRRDRGDCLPRGQYEELGLFRALHAAIAAVEHDEQDAWVDTKEQQFTRAQVTK
jgi:hypothetical protein